MVEDEYWKEKGVNKLHEDKKSHRIRQYINKTKWSVRDWKRRNHGKLHID